MWCDSWGMSSVAAGSVAVLALVSLTAVSALQARRAEAAEQQAQARRQQAEDVLSFMLGEFADKLRPIGRLELLDSVGSKALSILADRIELDEFLIETSLEKTSGELVTGPT